MWRYLRALGYMVTGRFTEAWKTLQENKYVMQATYDRAIQQSNERFKTVQSAVSELIMIEQTRVQELKEINAQSEKLTNVKLGAQKAMQRSIDSLKSQGKSKEEILSNPEFIRHKAAFDDASSTLIEINSRYADKDADLNERRVQLSRYKAELQQMQRTAKSLEDEKQTAVADVAIAQQQEAINATLIGLAKSTVDADLTAAREAHKRTVARAKVSSELAGNDARAAEDEYLQFAEQAKTTGELDSLLNWGDEGTAKDLAPAKLPESN